MALRLIAGVKPAYNNNNDGDLKGCIRHRSIASNTNMHAKNINKKEISSKLDFPSKVSPNIPGYSRSLRRFFRSDLRRPSHPLGSRPSKVSPLFPSPTPPLNTFTPQLRCFALFLLHTHSFGSSSKRLIITRNATQDSFLGLQYASEGCLFDA